MRTALVLRNPKWVPFTDALAEFKKEKDGSGAVLVVRGAVKEKRPLKSAQTNSK